MEFIKLGALLLGALIAPVYRLDIGIEGWLFVVLVLPAARPLAMLLIFVGSELDRPEWIAAAWLRPRGFASVFFALFGYRANIADGELIFHLLAMMVATSIIAHSSTDVLVARWFERAERTAAGPAGRD